ncbi:MAG TPA: hypothetical protein VGR65_06945 [Casimicrobiaceae bacterium]|jgi:hypothetical protein|nr:hypothetical protein [Casimicrobiaceae bacterium]
MKGLRLDIDVIPAEAEIQPSANPSHWIPAFAGMTPVYRAIDVIPAEAEIQPSANPKSLDSRIRGNDAGDSRIRGNDAGNFHIRGNDATVPSVLNGLDLPLSVQPHRYPCSC